MSDGFASIRQQRTPEASSPMFCTPASFIAPGATSSSSAAGPREDVGGLRLRGCGFVQLADLLKHVTIFSTVRKLGCALNCVWSDISVY